MAVPFADVADRVIGCPWCKEPLQARVRSDVVANISVCCRLATADGRSMGDYDVAVFSVSEEDAAGLQGETFRSLGCDSLLGFCMHIDVR